MGGINEYLVPAGYVHKATSHSFNEAESVVVYYSSLDGRYLIVFHSKLNERDTDGAHVFVNKTQLELIVNAANDVIDMR